jgi:hypothetical protein
MKTKEKKELLNLVLSGYNEKINPCFVKIENRNGFICFDLYKNSNCLKMLFSANTYNEALKLAHALCETLNILDLSKPTF